MPAAARTGLAEHGHVDVVGAQVAAQDEDIDFKALVAGIRRGIPVGDDRAAERIGAGDRHKIDAVQRGAPEQGVDADAVGLVFFLVIAAQDFQAAFAKDAVRLVVNVVVAAGGRAVSPSRVFGFAFDAGTGGQGKRGQDKQDDDSHKDIYRPLFGLCHHAMRKFTASGGFVHTAHIQMYRKIVLAAFMGMLSGPAQAGVELGFGGYMLNYGLYNHQAEIGGRSLRRLDMRKETRIQLTGETELENGLKVQALTLLYVDRPDRRLVDRGHITISGAFGQINAGENFGVPALLQVEVPHADEHIDGIDPKINAFDVSELGAGTVTPDALSYQQETSVKAPKLTYITPVLNGWQAGVTYTPSVSDDSVAAGDAAVPANQPGNVSHAAEAALRYEWQKDDWRVVLGAGASYLDAENAAAVPDSDFGSADQFVYNIGGTLSYKTLRGGISYGEDNNATAEDGDTDIAVYGLAYDVTDDLTLGASYYDRADEANRSGVGEATLDRLTMGGSYECIPGLSLRGSLSRLAAESAPNGEHDGYQLALGSDLRF